MFMGACAGATVSFLFIRNVLLPRANNTFDTVLREGEIVDRPLVSVLLGSGLLGVGMVLSGACPGMVLPQVLSLFRQTAVVDAGTAAAALAPCVCCIRKPTDNRFGRVSVVVCVCV